MTKPGPKLKQLINTTWRPELAYALGLLAADGSLSSDGRHIDFTSKDRDQIDCFCACLGLSHLTVGTKGSSSSKDGVYYRVQFGSVVFYRWLESIGFTANKSLTIGELNIPDAYFFDFLRGEWDGDGTIYESTDKRWPDSSVVSISFASGSKDFLMWLQETTKRLSGIAGWIQKGSRSYQLRYAKAGSLQLLHQMFYQDDLPHLSRKFAKAREIYKIDGQC